MRRTHLRLLLVITLLPLAGCTTDDGPSLFVSGHVKPDDECVLSPDNVLILRGALNAQFGFDYQIFPLLNNQLLNRGSTAPLRADPNAVLITGAEVELQDAAGNPLPFGGLPNPFTVATSVFVSSTDDPAEPARSVGSVQAIPPAYVDALDVMLGDDPLNQMVVIISAELFGETTGGVDVDGLTFTWPVDVCQGNCLFDCSPATTAGTTERNCTPWQDGLVRIDPLDAVLGPLCP